MSHCQGSTTTPKIIGQWAGIALIASLVACGGTPEGPEQQDGKGDFGDWIGGTAAITHPTCRVMIIGHMWFHASTNAIDALRGSDGYIYSGIGHDYDIQEILSGKGYTVELADPEWPATMGAGDLYIFSERLEPDLLGRTVLNIYLNQRLTEDQRRLNQDYMSPDNQLARDQGAELARRVGKGFDTRHRDGHFGENNAAQAGAPRLPDCRIAGSDSLSAPSSEGTGSAPSSEGTGVIVQQRTGTFCETPTGACTVGSQPINSLCRCGASYGRVVR